MSFTSETRRARRYIPWFRQRLALKQNVKVIARGRREDVPNRVQRRQVNAAFLIERSSFCEALQIVVVGIQRGWKRYQVGKRSKIIQLRQFPGGYERREKKLGRLTSETCCLCGDTIQAANRSVQIGRSRTNRNRAKRADRKSLRSWTLEHSLTCRLPRFSRARPLRARRNSDKWY